MKFIYSASPTPVPVTSIAGRMLSTAIAFSLTFAPFGGVEAKTQSAQKPVPEYQKHGFTSQEEMDQYLTIATVERTEIDEQTLRIRDSEFRLSPGSSDGKSTSSGRAKDSGMDDLFSDWPNAPADDESRDDRSGTDQQDDADDQQEKPANELRYGAGEGKDPLEEEVTDSNADSSYDRYSDDFPRGEVLEPSDVPGWAEILNPINAMVTVGLRIWKFIEQNQPASNLRQRRVSVLPSVRTNWQQMENWKGPAMKAYQVVVKNSLGGELVSFVYRVTFFHDGTFKKRGRFLANVTILPEDLKVGWATKLDSNIEVGDPVNYGTTEQPLPGLLVAINWKVKSKLSQRGGRDTFVVKGDGSSSRLKDEDIITK